MRRFAVLLALCAAATCASAGPLAYITNQGSHEVTVVDVDASTIVARLPAGKSPAGVWVSEAAGKAFVSAPDSARHQSTCRQKKSQPN